MVFVFLFFKGLIWVEVVVKYYRLDKVEQLGKKKSYFFGSYILKFLFVGIFFEIKVIIFEVCFLLIFEVLVKVIFIKNWGF